MEILNRTETGLRASPSTPSPPASSASAVEWFPLQRHPVFDRNGETGAALKLDAAFTHVSGGWNLAAWDSSSSRLYVWDPQDGCLHRLSLRFRSPAGSASVEAASPSEILRPSIQINLVVSNISLNRDGSSMLLSGYRGVYVMHIHGRISSSGNKSVCRTVFVGSQAHLTGNNILRTLQASWHPCSMTHLGVLSSDSVFRMYDLSSDTERPEQEYFLQPFEAGRCRNAASVFPVAFSFGGEHLWDRFSVFILFSDGSVYILCPVAPFGGVFNLPFVEEIYEDAAEFERKSFDSRAAGNCRLAVAWLESTFPELMDRAKDRPNLPVIRARSYAPVDASLSLQGPLRRVCGSRELEETPGAAELCVGRAVALLYSSIGKDSLLVIAWSSGQLQIDALADEVQPLWNPDSSPRLHLDSQGGIAEMAMICEPILGNSAESHDVNGSLEADSIWSGQPPTLLRLALVDLALPRPALDQPLSVFSDPLVSERLYCLHGGGIDLITLHFLPFSNLAASAGGSTDGSAASRPPSVCPILSTDTPPSRNGGEGGGASPAAPLRGFVVIADSFGDSQAVVVTSSLECISLEMKSWKDVLPHYLDDGDAHYLDDDERDDVDDDHGDGRRSNSSLVSRDILSGPKVIVVPDSTSLRSLSPESIQGRSALHHYIKLFHENFVEYAHKVYVELKQHGDHLKAILGEQHARLQEAGEMLRRVEDKQPHLQARINRAVQVYGSQERRLQSFKKLPAADRKPLSQAEREFKAQLERFRDAELRALNLSVEALNARLRRSLTVQSSSSPGRRQWQRPQTQGRRPWLQSPDAQRMSQLKESVEKLSRVNDVNVNKVKLIERALHSEGDVGQ